MKKLFKVNVKFFYNIPSMVHTKEITIEASDEIDAKEKIKRRYPNIINITVDEVYQ